MLVMKLLGRRLC
jgi:hypothetical protein